MPKTQPQTSGTEFGERLVQLMESAGHDRHGAGAYLARRYGVSAVTANAWLNGTHMCGTKRAKQIAEDHGSTFEALYFGQTAPEKSKRAVPSALAALLPAASPRSKARLTIYREKMERGEALTREEKDDLVRILKKLEAVHAASQ